MLAARAIHNLALIGFMGSGKSAVGRCAAHLLRFEFVDTDHLIETEASKPITRIFAEDGEPVFRDWERRIIDKLKDQSGLVISTGGGLPVHGDNLEQLKTCSLVVCLWASPETILQRVSGHAHRPLLNGPDPEGRIRELLTIREPFYRQADVLINTEQRSVREVAQQVMHEFQQVRRR